MSKLKTDLVSYTYEYNMFPVNLTILYKKNSSIEELCNSAIVEYPILLQMDRPNDNPYAFVYKNSIDNNIFLFLGNNISYSTIAHECVHIVSRIFEIIGSPITVDSEEFFAYLLNHTFEEVTNFCINTLKIKIPIISKI